MSGNYSKTQQKGSPTLLDMPLHVANLILEKMEPTDLLVVRKVSRSLRKAVEKFEIRFDYISIVLGRKVINMELHRNRECKMDIEYRNVDNLSSYGTVVRCNGEIKRFEETHFKETALNDLKIVWKHVSNLRIEKIQDTIKEFIDFMKSEQLVHVENIELQDFSLNDVYNILPLFDAETLENITIWNIESQAEKFSDQFKRISYLDQWKNATKCHIHYNDFESKLSKLLVHLFHFHSFEVDMMSDFPTQTAIQIRDELMRRSIFQGCVIRSYCSNTDPVQIAKVFEPEYAGDSDFEIEYSNDNETFQIKCITYNLNSQNYQSWLSFSVHKN